MTTGKLTIESPDGNVIKTQLTNGQAYSRNIGVDHNVINNNDFDFTFIEIELKNK
jgi:uncharacterized protein involved in tellurium resistance